MLFRSTFNESLCPALYVPVAVLYGRHPEPRKTHGDMEEHLPTKMPSSNASKNSSMRFNPPESSADSAIHSFQISNKRKTVSTLTTGSLNLIWNGLDLSLKRFQADR